MGKYANEFEDLFAQLEKMRSDSVISESLKAPILLASLCKTPELESTIAALRLKDSKDLTWEVVTADLIQEYDTIKSPQSRH